MELPIAFPCALACHGQLTVHATGNKLGKASEQDFEKGTTSKQMVDFSCDLGVTTVQQVENSPTHIIAVAIHLSCEARP